MTATQVKWKATKAFQNNGPDYWIIHKGSFAFGRKVIAQCYDEYHANLIAEALNAFTANQQSNPVTQ